MRGAKKAWATRSGTSTRTWRARVQRAAHPKAGCGKVAPRIVCPMPYTNRRPPITSSSGRLYIGSTFPCALPFDDQLPALFTALIFVVVDSWAAGRMTLISAAVSRSTVSVCRLRSVVGCTVRRPPQFKVKVRNNVLPADTT